MALIGSPPAARVKPNPLLEHINSLVPPPQAPNAMPNSFESIPRGQGGAYGGNALPIPADVAHGFRNPAALPPSIGPIGGGMPGGPVGLPSPEPGPGGFGGPVHLPLQSLGQPVHLPLQQLQSQPSLAHYLAAAAAAHPRKETQRGLGNRLHMLGEANPGVSHLPEQPMNLQPGLPAQGNVYPQLRAISPGLARAAAY